MAESFDLAGFKGQKLTFREWNRQLRQPILLAVPTAMVSVSPQQGFLHPQSPLDSLGWTSRNSAAGYISEKPNWPQLTHLNVSPRTFEKLHRS